MEFRYLTGYVLEYKASAPASMALNGNAKKLYPVLIAMLFSPQHVPD